MSDFNNGLTVVGGVVVDGFSVTPSTLGLAVSQYTPSGYAKITDITKTQAGLSNVDNTSDLNKPLNAIQSAYVLTEKEYFASVGQVAHVGVVNDSFIDLPSTHSDGGAWTDNCQDKSWYNETLGGLYWLNTRCKTEIDARAIIGSLNKPNLINNGVSDTGFAGFIDGGTGNVSVVNGNLRITNTVASTAYVYYSIPTVVNKTYVVYFDRMGGTGLGGVNVGTVVPAGSYVLNSQLSIVTFKATATVAYVTLHSYTNTVGQYYDFNNVVVKETDSNVSTEGYVYQSSDTGTKFYKLHTNLLQYSNDFSNAVWGTSIGGTGVTPSLTHGQLAPDGTLTATTIVFNTAAGTSTNDMSYFKHQAIAGLPVGSIYTGSIYVKGTSGTKLVFRNVAGGTYTLVTLTGQWDRVYSVETSSSATEALSIGLRQGLFGTINSTATATIWGGQLNQGSELKAYEPKTTSDTYGTTEVFRGIKREYPKTGVYWVAENYRLIGYDLVTGAMWMVFKCLSTAWPSIGMVGRYSVYPTSVHGCNGTLLIGRITASAEALISINFISEMAQGYVSSYQYIWPGKISRRNEALVITVNSSLSSTVYSIIYEVKAVALDGAIVDPLTNLPTPTLIAGTDGNITIIRPDGTTAISTGVVRWNKLNIDQYGNLTAIQSATGFVACFGLINNLASSFTFGNSYTYGASFPAIRGSIWSASRLSASKPGKYIMVGTDAGLEMIKESTSKALGMIAQITTLYNTGWQVGDLRLSTLADTATGAVNEVTVLNGNFNEYLTTGDVLAAGYYGSASGTGGFVTLNAGSLDIGSSTTDARALMKNVTTEIGKNYIISIDVMARSVSVGVFHTTTATLVIPITAATGKLTGTFVATGTTTLIGVTLGDASRTATIDNLIVKLAEPDRSIKNGGLIVNGTLTKSVVATGASLVAYSGFSTVNYLEQPYSSNLDFGTGDFSIACWFTGPSSLTGYPALVCRNKVGYSESDSNAWNLKLDKPNQGVYFHGNGVNRIFTTNKYTPNSWNHVVFLRISGIPYIYLNGIVSVGASDTSNYTLSGASVFVGALMSVNITMGADSSMSLVRISATAPSLDQIAQIYRDELPLFQPGAQCTIAGDVKRVSSMDYDQVTDILHAGTTWGRSGFKNLLRLDSEASSVGSMAGISARNGTVLTSGTNSVISRPRVSIRDELNRQSTLLSSSKNYVPFEYTAIASQTVFPVPKGYSIKKLYKNGVPIREFTSGVYWTRSNDGYQEYATLSSACSAGDWIAFDCIGI